MCTSIYITYISRVLTYRVLLGGGLINEVMKSNPMYILDKVIVK